MSAYLLVKYFHVLLAIVAFGSNITYAVWFARAKKEPQAAAFALRGIKFIDDRIANPAYGLLLPTGALMVWLGGYSFGTKWIAWAMGLWVLLVIIGAGFYTPTLKKQIAAVVNGGAGSPEAARLDSRGQMLGIVLAIIVLAILVLMIFKPA